MTRENIPDDGQLLRADVELLFPSPTNPRKSFPEAELQELADSITALGIMQPIVVRPLPAEIKARVAPLADTAELEIVVGERRWRAAQLAGQRDVPILLRHLDDCTVICMQVVENLQREGLNPMDEAEGFGQLQAQGMSADQIAESVGKGKSKAYVYAKLKLLDLCHEARDALRNKVIIESIAVLIARIPVPEMQIDAVQLVSARDDYTGETMSFRKARTLIAERYTRNLSKAPFDPADPTLTAAGECKACPHYLANQPGADSSANVCTRPPCHEAKRQAHNIRLLALPPDTPRIEVPKIEGTTGATNWTDYDASGYRQLTSVHQTDPLRRNYGDWLKAHNETIPLAIHVEPTTGDARIVVRTDDLIKAAKRIEARAAATAEQQRLTVVDEETEHEGEEQVMPAAATASVPVKAPAPAPIKPKTEQQDSQPKHSADAIRLERYKAALRSAILAEPPMLLAGPMLHIVARALSGSYAPIGSDGEAMQIIIGTLTDRAAKKPYTSTQDGLDDIADALSVNRSELMEKFSLPVDENTPRSTSSIPYRHPANTSICWSGRGRKPQWVLDWVAQGKSITDLENPDYRKEAA